MTAMRRTIKRLTFEFDVDGEVKTYVVPPVDDAAGTRLASILTMPPAQAAESKIKPTDLFKLAMTAELWDQMRSDGVGFMELRTVGLAALVHFQVLLQDPNPSEALDHAERAARSVWEAGVDPESLAAEMAALRSPTSSPTQRSTRPAAARTTPSRASGTGTRQSTAKRTAKKPASRSRGSGSKRSAS